MTLMRSRKDVSRPQHITRHTAEIGDLQVAQETLDDPLANVDDEWITCQHFPITQRCAALSDWSEIWPQQSCNVSAKDHYIQFPLCALAIVDEPSTILNLMLSYGVTRAGLSILDALPEDEWDAIYDGSGLPQGV